MEVFAIDSAFSRTNCHKERDLLSGDIFRFCFWTGITASGGRKFLHRINNEAGFGERADVY
jgi:hypothetical protein